MATNLPAGDGHRNGAVRGRSQVQNPQSGLWTKRDALTGQFIDQKADPAPFKGVRKEHPTEQPAPLPTDTARDIDTPIPW